MAIIELLLPSPYNVAYGGIKMLDETTYTPAGKNKLRRICGFTSLQYI
jgi:hypothetical protein